MSRPGASAAARRVRRMHKSIEHMEGKMRTCTVCGETKQDICFEQCGHSKKTEIPYFCRYCRRCKSNLGRLRARLRKEHAIRPDQCECCSRPGKLHLDHDWETGRFRGFLCRQCNISIGGLNFNTASDKQGLLRAVAYLERSE